MNVDVPPGYRVGYGMLIAQWTREGRSLKVDVYGGDAYEADRDGAVRKLDAMSETVTFSYSNDRDAEDAEFIVKTLCDFDAPVIVRIDDLGSYGSITEPTEGLRIAAGRQR